MAGWHHGLNGHEFEQDLGDGEGQGSLVLHGVAKSCTRLSDCIELNIPLYICDTSSLSIHWSMDI